MRRLGQMQAVLVYRDAGGWEAIDGFKRVREACALEWAGSRVEELDVDAAGAKVRLWQSNAGRGMTELEEAWLIRSLHRDEGWAQVEIALARVVLGPVLVLSGVHPPSCRPVCTDHHPGFVGRIPRNR